MASTKFEISKKDRNGTSELIVRFCYNRRHSYRLHTNIWVPQTAWNTTKGKLVIPRMHGKEHNQLSQQQAQIDELASFLKSECITATDSADKDYWIKKILEFHKMNAPQPDSSSNNSDESQNPGKGQTYVQKRQAKKQAKADKKATFMLYYDPNLSAAKNREKMLQYGLNLSVGTIRNWGKEYAMPSTPTSSTSPSPESSILNLGPINVTVPSFNSSWWNSWENDPLYAEYEAKWREACRR